MGLIAQITDTNAIDGEIVKAFLCTYKQASRWIDPKNDFQDRQHTRGFILSTLTLEGIDPRLDEIDPPLR